MTAIEGAAMETMRLILHVPLECPYDHDYEKIIRKKAEEKAKKQNSNWHDNGYYVPLMETARFSHVLNEEGHNLMGVADVYVELQCIRLPKGYIQKANLEESWKRLAEQGGKI